MSTPSDAPARERVRSLRERAHAALACGDHSGAAEHFDALHALVHEAAQGDDADAAHAGVAREFRNTAAAWTSAGETARAREYLRQSNAVLEPTLRRDPTSLDALYAVQKT